MKIKRRIAEKMGYVPEAELEQYMQYVRITEDRVCALAADVSRRQADIAYLKSERAVMATLLDEWVPNWRQRVDAQMPGYLKSWKEDSKGRL